MMRFTLAAALLAIPLALFAQASGTPQGALQNPERRALVQLGLTDAQVTQVVDIQARTRDAMRQAGAQLRILQAQIDKDMLANPVDLQAVNALVDQAAQARAGMRKTLLAARAQMQQIMGVDNFLKYMRGVRRALAHRFPRLPRWRGMQGGAMGGAFRSGDGGWM